MIDVDERALERNNASLERFQRGGVMNVIFNDIKDRAIDGQVIKFNVPFPYGNGLVMFKPGSFGDVSNRTVGFHIDHIGSTCVGDTDSALELMVDDDGIQFRLDLKKTERSYVVARMCEVGSRNAMSVGCDILDENDETIAEHTVRVVERARLREITLCKEGCAGDNAFAMLVDTTVTPKPVAGSRSAIFNAQRALLKVARTVRTLKAQIAMRNEQPMPVKRSMTLDQSNRLQTAENEELAANARARSLRSM